MRRASVWWWAVALAAALALAAGARAQGGAEGDRCASPEGRPGVCANIRRCAPLLELLRSQRQRPDAADYLRRSVCGYDALDPIVCCPGADTRSPPTPAPAPAPAPECGFSNASHTRVVGGWPAARGAWPWMVALGYRPSARSTSKAPRFLCGASLISLRHVLTAAHCVYNRQDLYFVRLGEHDLESDADGASPEDVAIRDRRVHEGYNPNSFVNDIALLTLERDITPTLAIHPICLPLAPAQRERNLVGSMPFIAGWGAKHFSGPSSSELLELQIPVVTQEKCKTAFERFKTAVIDERVLCAGYEKGGKDACQGDSGGPLMAPNGTTYYQIGVVSYGYRCAEPGVPGVYTRVTYFLDWIAKNMK
ncbi:hypothetical protein R5R35_013155 [Gryllus longicercus]|uniref:CLIP domain-containing serine protease n=1 Tax=Gryllus longicercus TaxID=2509291 RepID=A0AAN9Z0M1_9ORTH